MQKLLPAQPSLEHLKKQAKALLKAHLEGNSKTNARIRQFHPEWSRKPDVEIPPGEFSLSDAQWVIAREYSFPSWTRLKRYIEEIEPYSGARGLSGERWYVETHEQRARELLTDHKAERLSAVTRLRAHVPRFLDTSDEEILNTDVTLDDARQVVAREHAFPSWAGLIEWFETRLGINARIVELCERGSTGDHDALDELFTLLREDSQRWHTVYEQAFYKLGFGKSMPTMARSCAAVLQGKPTRKAVNREVLERFIAEGLTDALMVAAVWRRKDETVHILLDAGATIGALTIGHQTALEAAILERGVHARKIADRLAAQRVYRNCLWVAAGAGRLDLVKRFFKRDGSLTPEAGSHRMNFANLGFLPGLPKTNNRQEVIDEALFAACRMDRPEIVKYLVEQGANPNGRHDIFNTTPLQWAADSNGVESVRHLLLKGVSPNTVSQWGMTPLHHAVARNNIELVRVLLEAGAPLDVRDKENDGTPLGWVKGTEADEAIAHLLRSYGATE